MSEELSQKLYSSKELTREEKVYGSIASALIMAVASIVVQLLR